MTTDALDRLLDRVRKLLAKAEAEGVTPPEAQALTAKAAELMARYGIDRALLAAARLETDAPGSRLVDLDNPWKRVKAHLLCGLGAALRCQCILPTTRTGLRVHMFGKYPIWRILVCARVAWIPGARRLATLRTGTDKTGGHSPSPEDSPGSCRATRPAS